MPASRHARRSTRRTARRSAHRSARPSCRPLVGAALLAAALAPAAAAQETFLYGITEGGDVTVNGTVLDALSSSVSSNDPIPNLDPTRWVDLVVEGSDRTALRADGRVSFNGSKLLDLPYDELAARTWTSLANDPGRGFWAIRSDGLLSNDGTSVIDFPAEIPCEGEPPKGELGPGAGEGGGGEGDEPPPTNCFFAFTKVLYDGRTTWCLRQDGAIFRWPGTPDPVFQLEAGAGVGGAGEGEATDTTWIDMALNPDTGNLLCLRRDGKVVRAEVALANTIMPPAGFLLASFPFDGSITLSNLYNDIEFTSDLLAWVVRGDGAIFNQMALVDPVVDLPGSPDEDGIDALYVDLVPDNDIWFCVRWDGRTYALPEGGEETVNLAKTRYRRLALSNDPPDLTNFKNSKPVVTGYTVQAVEGEAVVFPVLATDTDKHTADLVITVDEETLPEGAVWDEEARTISWDNPTPVGKYKIKTFTDDGIAKPVKRTFTVRVRALDTDPDNKNKKPRAGKIKAARALVGIPFVLPILATDEDGDELTWSVDETQEIFQIGGAFDPETAVFTWDDPEGRYIGKWKVTFLVTDGIVSKPVKRKVTIELKSSILAF